MTRSPWLRSTGQLVIAVAAVVALAFVAPLNIGVRLLVDTLLVMSGNDSDGSRMVDQLHGYLNPAAPNYGYPGYTYQLVPWNADLFAPGSTVDAQQLDGVATILAAIDAAYATDPADKLAVVGFSSSADVVIRAIRALDARGASAPSADQLSFLVLGNPNRPNGGIFTRIPGLHIPGIGATFEPGGNPDTDYALTDIAWKYATIEDFPKYPLNLLAVANSLLGFTNHADYSAADIANAVVDPNMTGQAPDGTTYITIAPEHLPLLAPLYQLGVPARVLDAITPALTVLIELGYDRSTPVWQASKFGLLPPLSALLAAVPALAKAVLDGAKILVTGEKPASAPAVTVADVLTARSALTARAAALPEVAEQTTEVAQRALVEPTPAEAADVVKTGDAGKSADAVKPVAAVADPVVADPAVVEPAAAPEAVEPEAVKPEAVEPEAVELAAPEAVEPEARAAQAPTTQTPAAESVAAEPAVQRAADPAEKPKKRAKTPKKQTGPSGPAGTAPRHDRDPAPADAKTEPKTEANAASPSADTGE